ncbi:hypothetical protein GCM10027082_47310 [Comamonas humi]
MNHIETIDAIIELAKTGQQIDPYEALNTVARLVNDLEPGERNYDARVAGLMQVGATLWTCAVKVEAAERDVVVKKAVDAVGRAVQHRNREISVWHPAN